MNDNDSEEESQHEQTKNRYYEEMNQETNHEEEDYDYHQWDYLNNEDFYNEEHEDDSFYNLQEESQQDQRENYQTDNEYYEEILKSNKHYYNKEEIEEYHSFHSPEKKEKKKYQNKDSLSQFMEKFDKFEEVMSRLKAEIKQQEYQRQVEHKKFKREGIQPRKIIVQQEMIQEATITLLPEEEIMWRRIEFFDQQRKDAQKQKDKLIIEKDITEVIPQPIIPIQQVTITETNDNKVTLTDTETILNKDNYKLDFDNFNEILDKKNTENFLEIESDSNIINSFDKSLKHDSLILYKEIQTDNNDLSLIKAIDNKEYELKRKIRPVVVIQQLA